MDKRTPSPTSQLAARLGAAGLLLLTFVGAVSRAAADAPPTRSIAARWIGTSGAWTSDRANAAALVGTRAVVAFCMRPITGGPGSGELRVLKPSASGWVDTGSPVRSPDPACSQFGMVIRADGTTVAVGSNSGQLFGYEVVGDQLALRWVWQAPCAGPVCPLTLQQGLLLVGLPGLAGGRGGAQIVDITGAVPAVVSTLEAPAGYSSLGSSGGMSSDDIVLSAEYRADVSAAATWRRVQGQVWQFEGPLHPVGATSGAIFGCSSAIDQGVIVVGARDDSGAARQSGAGFVFERRGGNWVQTAKITLSDGPLVNQECGGSVSVRDGTVFVGATGNLENGTGDRGRVLVATRSGASWGVVQTLRLPESGLPTFVNVADAGPNGRVALVGNDCPTPFTTVRGRLALFAPFTDCDADGLDDLARTVEDVVTDLDFNGVPDCCEASPSCRPCASDLDGNRLVDTADISLLLLDFGPCAGCPSDLDGSGTTDTADLSLLLLDFGLCP